MDSELDSLEGITNELESESVSFAKENWLPGGSVATGAGLELSGEISSQKVFDDYITPYGLDKPMHLAFSYGCAHYILDGLNKIGLEENYYTKWAIVGSLTVAAGWFVKEEIWDSYSDPTDMAANMAGVSLAITEDYYDRDISERIYDQGKDIYGWTRGKVTEGFEEFNQKPEDTVEPRKVDDYLKEDD